MLRSCYETDCQWFQDGSTGRIVWYFVDNDAPALGLDTAFGSHNWDSDHLGYEGVGEVWGAARTYRTGLPVGDAAGTNLCGTADQWLNGDPAPPLVPVPTDVYGTPACCAKLEPPFLVYDCPICPDGQWSDYTLVVDGIGPLPAAAPLNGQFRVTYAGDCLWLGDPFTVSGFPGFTFQWKMGPGFNQLGAVLHINGNPGNAFFLRDPNDWDCLNAVRLPITSTFAPLTGTPTMVIYPGIPSEGPPNACSSLVTTLPAYYVITPDPGIPIGYYLRAATYQFLQDGPCVWRGRIEVLTNPASPLGGEAFADLSVDAFGVVTLSLHNGALFPGGNFAEYTSMGPWDGSTTISLGLSTPRGTLQRWPDFIQLSGPILP